MKHRTIAITNGKGTGLGKNQMDETLKHVQWIGRKLISYKEKALHQLLFDALPEPSLIKKQCTGLGFKNQMVQWESSCHYLCEDTQDSGD